MREKRVGESAAASRAARNLQRLELGEVDRLRERCDPRVIEHEEVLDGVCGGGDGVGVRRVDVDREHDLRSVALRDARSLPACEFGRVIRGDYVAFDEESEHRKTEVRREPEEPVHRIESAQVDADYALQFESERR